MYPWSTRRGRDVARGVLHTSPKNLLKVHFFAIGAKSERNRDLIACFRLSSARMGLYQTHGMRRPLIAGRFVNTAVRGPALDVISIRAAVVCVPLLVCAGWRHYTDSAVPPVLLKTSNNTSYPCPASEARAPVCPTWPTK